MTAILRRKQHEAARLVGAGTAAPQPREDEKQKPAVKTFYLRYRVGKKVRYFRLGNAAQSTVARFRNEALKHLADVVKGGDPMELKQQPPEHTLKTFLAVYKG